jgi:predicted CoA-substrate-specific enzyme activase
MYFLGIDIGSLSCDAVLIDEKKQILNASVVPTGAKNQEAIERVCNDVLTASHITKDKIDATVSTGYGRERVESRHSSVTEITCHAKGIHFLMPEAEVLIDIGGQDSKAIRIDPNGRVLDFAMNDKCAAGTGRFLEAMARALQVDIEELSNMDQDVSESITISSMCTVFAESEVVSLIANGTSVKEIVNALNRSISSRTIGLVKRVAPDTNGVTIAMSGGVAHNKGVVNALSKILQTDIRVPEKPDTMGALGAALIAFERTQKEF